MTWKSIGLADNLAQSLGVNIAAHKLLAFAVGCFFAGVAGAFYAHFIRFLFPPEFGFLVATNILVYNFVGGRGHFVGPIVGAVFLTLLSEPFRGSAYETIFFSIAMLLTILFLPGRPHHASREAGRTASGAEPRRRRRRVRRPDSMPLLETRGAHASTSAGSPLSTASTSPSRRARSSA